MYCFLCFMFGSQIPKPFPESEKKFRDCLVSRLNKEHFSFDINFNGERRNLEISKEYLQIIDDKLELILWSYWRLKEMFELKRNLEPDNEDIDLGLDGTVYTLLMIYELKSCLDNVANTLFKLYFGDEFKHESSLKAFGQIIKKRDKKLFEILEENKKWIIEFNRVRNNLAHNHNIPTIIKDDFPSNKEGYDFTMNYLWTVIKSFFYFCYSVDEHIEKLFTWESVPNLN